MEVTNYAAGCDGIFQHGWWIGRLVANNKTRFLARTIGGDDIVKDRATGLIWAADGSAAGCGNGAAFTWLNALAYCEALNFAGFPDWHLPSVNQLLSLVFHDRSGCAIDSSFFPNTEMYEYWSSTTCDVNSGYAWYVDFDNGQKYWASKSSEFFLRAVRWDR